MIIHLERPVAIATGTGIADPRSLPLFKGNLAVDLNFSENLLVRFCILLAAEADAIISFLLNFKFPDDLLSRCFPGSAIQDIPPVYIGVIWKQGGIANRG